METINEIAVLLFKKGGVVGAEQLLQYPVDAHFAQFRLTFQTSDVFVPRQIADAKRGGRLQFHVRVRLFV